MGTSGILPTAQKVKKLVATPMAFLGLGPLSERKHSCFFQHFCPSFSIVEQIKKRIGFARD